MSRLANGGLVERTSRLSFRFDGRAYMGHAGDTLASALMANGVRLVGRSFKYHRPRGIVTAGPDEPNALVELREGARREPNTKATTVELYDGLVAASQNRWPSLAFDVMAVNQLAAPIFHAGFYYKTFMWPASFWERLYEPAIRRAAGLGRLSGLPDPDTYEKATAHCDVLVVGSGPAGLAAALAAGRAGARVILADEDFRFGGRLLTETLEIGGRAGAVFAGEVIAELASLPNVRLMARTTVFGGYDGGTFGALERLADHIAEPGDHQARQKLWRIVARTTVIAAGAGERPIAFGGNDLPGVTTASAFRAYLNRFATAPAKSLVVFTATDEGWRTARDARAAGLHVEAVVDVRAEVDPALKTPGVAAFLGARLADAYGNRHGVTALRVIDGGGREVMMEADGVAVSGGFDPRMQLATHLGDRPRFEPAIAGFVADRVPEGMILAGAAAGRPSLGACLASGAEAGRTAAERAGRAAAAAPLALPKAEDEAHGVTAFFHVAEARRKAFVDFQHDVTVDDVRLAHREGYRSVEHLKRYTTLGMATDQGRLSNVVGLAVMAEASGRSIPETGIVTQRPPVTPVAIGALAGPHRARHFKPTRLPPSHPVAVELGAVFMEAGLWLRAQWIPRPGEPDWLAATIREVNATRGGVGICDVSTLGKIDVQGPDAGAFLDFVYANRMSTLPVGKVRYGLMLREDGFVMDDGTAARLGEGHYVVTTTTANAVKVMQHMEFCRQVLRPDFRVALASVTDQWAQISIAGPNARRLLERVVDPGTDLSNAAFPFMAAAPVPVLGGIGGRLFRVSFSGELAYELAVPARHGERLTRRLLADGADLGATLYGIEALSVMRVEKGHPAGQELNGTTTAHDLGMGRLLKADTDFIGRAMAARPALTDPARPRLVGLKPVDPKARLRGGAHLIARGAAATAANDAGYVTSAIFSPALGRWIGLGLLANGPERTGEIVVATDLLRGETVEVEVTSPVFLDPEGARLRG